jgi:hypothetical protein
MLIALRNNNDQFWIFHIVYIFSVVGTAPTSLSWRTSAWRMRRISSPVGDSLLRRAASNPSFDCLQLLMNPEEFYYAIKTHRLKNIIIVLQIRDVYPGSEFFSLSDPDPGRIRIKEFKYFNPKNCF